MVYVAWRAPTFPVPRVSLVRIPSRSLLIRAVTISRAILRNRAETRQLRDSIILFRRKSIFQSLSPSLFLIPLTAERRNKRSRLSITYPDYLSFRFTRRKYAGRERGKGFGAVRSKSERGSVEQTHTHTHARARSRQIRRYKLTYFSRNLLIGFS